MTGSMDLVFHFGMDSKGDTLILVQFLNVSSSCPGRVGLALHFIQRTPTYLKTACTSELSPNFRYFSAVWNSKARPFVSCWVSSGKEMDPKGSLTFQNILI
jgi:hypothetical protein